VLAVFSILGGHISLPLAAVLPPAAGSGDEHMQHRLEILSVCVSTSGILVAYLLFLRWPKLSAALARGPGRLLQAYWRAAWGFDWLYDRLFVRPYYWFSRTNRNDAVDELYSGIAAASRAGHRMLSRTQTGSLRWYAAGMAGGTIVVIVIVMLEGSGMLHLFGR
jgi:NADH-quinone oxidoreductase subunit L